ncbi:hypothetical protein [Streptomyces rapamycinicus]|uniref:Uncharacterized protein n=2 Tax=Streptomyces rapamycinicus TaxID=1226757 RepID=A0A3L8RQL4_STRRN|nr:hypothetical protein [Streptomyces rapamycinicus]MBB4783263.1 hypothetical protein [Streptomyces rapamycinicus]RLV81262.1 hypothetical protein D3C57_122795 [Streptomyces rapamycinicus NRRL 5491]UTO63675.1 hypothetical protein LJB45_16000 [Streptomyces rapamycinicus]UTP31629.1 hypothetical protein LIV37_21110 [Streptomyces rapamycinicus NRRL 5491]
MAHPLVQLGPNALRDDKDEVRVIGERLNQEGGYPLMVTVLHRAEAGPGAHLAAVGKPGQPCIR